MPELPEVETIKNSLLPKILKQRIEKIDIHLEKIIKLPINNFKKLLIGQKIIEIKRIGKYLFFYLDNDNFLVIHLRMTGQLLWVNKNLLPDKHTHQEFYFYDNPNKLIYRDLRQFGIMEIIKQEDFQNYLIKKNLATDALLISEDEFIENLTKISVPIKTALLNQKIIAGIGNIYADEVLFRAKINPKKLANTLTIEQVKDLLLLIKKVLNSAILAKGTSISDYIDADGKTGGFQYKLNVYKKEKTFCKNCKTIIIKEKINGRNTRFCPNCQIL